jgi:hypothetical protein
MTEAFTVTNSRRGLAMGDQRHRSTGEAQLGATDNKHELRSCCVCGQGGIADSRLGSAPGTGIEHMKCLGDSLSAVISVTRDKVTAKCPIA